MSTVKANNVQVGQSGTATNNFTLYQPSTPDGTVRLAVGNSGATSADVLTANSSGNVGIGTSSPTAYSGYATLALNGSSGGVLEFQRSGTQKARIGIDGATDTLLFVVANTEWFRITSAGAWGLSGANYGLAGQALVSQGSGLPPVWGSAGVSTAKAVALALVFG